MFVQITHPSLKNAIVLLEIDLFNAMFTSIFMLFSWLPFYISRAGALAIEGMRHIHMPWIYLAITACLLILFLNFLIWNMNNNLMPSEGQKGFHKKYHIIWVAWQKDLWFELLLNLAEYPFTIICIYSAIGIGSLCNSYGIKTLWFWLGAVEVKMLD